MKKFLVIAVLVIILASCTGGSGAVYWELAADEADFILPDNAINVVDKGNGWIQFDLDDNTYLLLYRKHGSGRATAVTQVQ